MFLILFHLKKNGDLLDKNTTKKIKTKKRSNCVKDLSMPLLLKTTLSNNLNSYTSSSICASNFLLQLAKGNVLF